MPAINFKLTYGQLRDHDADINRQAIVILQKVQEEKNLNPNVVVGITYSANDGQTAAIRKASKQNEALPQITGVNQAKVMERVRNLLLTDAWQHLKRNFWILPITTTFYGREQPRNREFIGIVKNDLDKISAFEQNPNHVVLLWRNQELDYAVGGGVTPLPDNVHKLIQNTLQSIADGTYHMNVEKLARSGRFYELHERLKQYEEKQEEKQEEKESYVVNMARMGQALSGITIAEWSWPHYSDVGKQDLQAVVRGFVQGGHYDVLDKFLLKNSGYYTTVIHELALDNKEARLQTFLQRHQDKIDESHALWAKCLGLSEGGHYKALKATLSTHRDNVSIFKFYKSFAFYLAREGDYASLIDFVENFSAPSREILKACNKSVQAFQNELNTEATVGFQAGAHRELGERFDSWLTAIGNLYVAAIHDPGQLSAVLDKFNRIRDQESKRIFVEQLVKVLIRSSKDSRSPKERSVLYHISRLEQDILPRIFKIILDNPGWRQNNTLSDNFDECISACEIHRDDKTENNIYKRIKKVYDECEAEQQFKQFINDEAWDQRGVIFFCGKKTPENIGKMRDIFTDNQGDSAKRIIRIGVEAKKHEPFFRNGTTAACYKIVSECSSFIEIMSALGKSNDAGIRGLIASRPEDLAAGLNHENPAQIVVHG